MSVAKENLELNYKYKFYEALRAINDQARYKPKSKKGLFCLTIIHKDGKTSNHYDTDPVLLMEHANADPFNNWYMALNTFRTYNRSATRKDKAGVTYNNIHTLTAFYLDFDVHNAGLNMQTFRDALPGILKESGIAPTEIKNSGHGYHVIILLKAGVVANAQVIVNLWHHIEAAMIAKVTAVCQRKYGKDVVDHKPSDVNRILRVVGPFNMKSTPRPVFIDYMNMNNRPTLWQLKEQWLPEITKHRDHQRTKKSIDRIHQYKKYKKHWHNPNGNNARDLNYATCLDLFDLPTLRKHEAKTNPDPLLVSGYREDLLFYYAVSALRIMPDKYAKINLKHLNARFMDPLPESEVDHVINEFHLIHIRIKQHKYIYTHAKIIDDLNINKHEMKHLRTLVDHPEALRRYHEKRKQRKHTRKMNRIKRNQTKAVRNAKIIELHNQGLSVRKIAKQVNVGKTTVGKVIRAVQDNTKSGVHFSGRYVSKYNGPKQRLVDRSHGDITDISKNNSELSKLVIGNHKYYINLRGN